MSITRRDVLMDCLAEIERLQRGLTDVEELIDNSSGVGGLHLNGDMAPWTELRTGGRFEEWLKNFDAAILKECEKEAKA